MVDFRATRHICANRNALPSDIDVGEGKEIIFVSNSKRVAVISKGIVNLKLNLREIFSLKDVLYVPGICYNLIFVSILGKAGVKIIFENNKVVLTKCGNIVEKRYYNNGLFLLNVSYVMDDNACSNVYLIDSIDL